jgi:histidine phosphotransferase ChpT
MSKDIDLAALIGSRICHDLISPIGAIGNGVELLLMDGGKGSPELALVSESVAQAAARIRFFRLAFGAAQSGDLRVTRADILAILADQTRGSRLQVTWTSPADLPRPEVKIAFLLLLCLETALPFGGRVAIACEGGGWRLSAAAERMKPDAALWDALAAGAAPVEVAPARVQFALVGPELQRIGRVLAVHRGETEMTLAF